jgi:hypothetical protein
VRWNPWAVFLREHGIWLIFLPVLWVFFAVSAQRLDRGFFSYHVAIAIGLGLAVALIAVFLYSAVFPYTRPLFSSFLPKPFTKQQIIKAVHQARKPARPEIDKHRRAMI